MFLTRHQIYEVLGEKYNEKEENRLAPHYNLRVQSIIDISQRKPEAEEVLLKPQHCVTIVTKSITLPENYIGLLYPKKAIERDGLLVFNTGIVHPSYSGPLSIQLVNLSRNDYHIEKGKTILELLVYKNESSFNKYQFNSNNYIDNRIRDAKNLPKTFLDIEENKKEIRGVAAQGFGILFKTTIVIIGAAFTFASAYQAYLAHTTNTLINKFQETEKISDRLDSMKFSMDKMEEQLRR